MRTDSSVDPTREAQNFTRWHEARRYAATSYGEIAYHEFGRGAALVLLHGFPLNAYHWRTVIDILSRERRCIAPDLMGLGYTHPVRGADLGLVAQAGMVAEFLKRLSVDRTDVIANDSGTAIAQLLAVDHPGLVRSMLLTNGDVETDCPPEPLRPVIELARQGRFAEAMVTAALNDKEFARSEQGVIGLTFTNPRAISDEAIEMYFAPLVESPERVAMTDKYAASLVPNPLAGLEARLHTCFVPTAILWGSADRFFKPTNVDYLRHVLPTVAFTRQVDGAALFFPEEYPELVAESARELWATTTEDGRARGVHRRENTALDA